MMVGNKLKLPLSLKILLPLFIGSLTVLVCGWVYLKIHFEHGIENQIQRRAEAMANSLDQFTWIMGISPELKRAIASMGAEKDVETIAIVQRTPMKTLAIALKRYQESPWDVILMDCHMPQKNGYDTTKDIRELERGTNKHVPIVAMTANAMVGDREKCLHYGMDEYLSKPLSVDDLKEVLSQWIIFDDESKTHGEAYTFSDRKDVVDLAQIRSFSDGDIAMEKELVVAFITQSDKNLILLKKNADADGENQGWIEAAHMFKGGAAGAGADTLAKLCNQAQHFTGTPAERAELYEKIDQEYALVKTYLEKQNLYRKI